MVTFATATRPVAGGLASATAFGQPIYDLVTLLAGQGSSVLPRAVVYSGSAGTSIGGGGGTTPVGMDTEVVDSDGMHSGSSSRLTVQTAGLYLIVGQVSVPSLTSGRTVVSLTANGNQIAATDLANASHAVEAQCFAIYVASVGDYLEVNVMQNSGAAVTTNTGGKGTTFLAAFMPSL